MIGIEIRPIEEGQSYRVRNKVVYKDMNGNWVSVTELTPHELKAFDNYKEAVINNPELNAHPSATYTY